MTGSAAPVLQVRNLRVSYATPAGFLHAVDDVSFDLAAGESLGVVGESGCGKSTMGKGLMRLLPPGAQLSGSVRLHGEEVVGLSRRRLRKIRGDEMALVFQEPMTRLDPLMKVSDHFVEAIRAHRPKTSKSDAVAMASGALAQMGIPPTRVHNYPHEFSGGMRQRIMIALSVVMQPAVIVADEPTTALDVIVEAQILDLLDGLRRNEDLGLILITHNLGIVAETCDRVAVMYAGRIVEVGPVEEVFTDPKHPYTQGLLRSVISTDTTELSSIDGFPPNLLDPPPGCRFAARCDQVLEHCTTVDPVLAPLTEQTRVACLLYPQSHPSQSNPSPSSAGEAASA
ncbi:ABC transporter ATP-binding protein [Euzebya tangerina]|uniref:ABC transporter ATP-binding protein n=1 Tax=Euzebya tangerina TaxID=591198 RepID=UPI00196AA2D3|nr:ABC transporter ATP-binding protein [Euzebya tangerina]